MMQHHLRHPRHTRGCCGGPAAAAPRRAVAAPGRSSRVCRAAGHTSHCGATDSSRAEEAQPQTPPPPARAWLAGAAAVAASCSLLLTSAAAAAAAGPPAHHSSHCDGAAAVSTASTTSNSSSAGLAAAPALSWQRPPELAQLAFDFDAPRQHWLVVVLGIGAVNVLGLQAVLKLLQASKDSSTPVTLLVVRVGLRVDPRSSQLQRKLLDLRGLLAVDHATSMFFTLEEAMQAMLSPPRGCQLAYADVEAVQLGSKQAGYDRFKQAATREAVRAEQEEAQQVVRGEKPDAPQHRNILQKLLGAEETQDAEEAQACLLVSCIALAKGRVQLPDDPLRSQGAFRATARSLCGHLSSGQLLALEMLLTPEDPADFLSEARLIADYPSLTDLASGLRVDHPQWSPVPSPLSSAEDGNAFAEAAAAAAVAAAAAEEAGARPGAA